MNDGSVPPSAPPPAVKAAGKPPYLMIGIGVVVLIVLAMMFSGHSSSGSSAGGAASSTGAPAAAGGNPLLGTWTLLDTSMSSVCRAEREFKTYEDAQANHEATAIYVVNPTYVEVGYGGPNIEEWELHGPDDVTLRMASPNSVGYSDVGAQAQANCRYHRK